MKAAGYRIHPLWRVLLTLIVAVCLGACSRPAPVEPPDRCVVVLYFNDFHGHLEPFQGSNDTMLGGMARIKTLVDSQRQEAKRKGCGSILLAAGDMVQGTAMSQLLTGHAEISAMNLLGVDAMVIGNHEFDFGLKRLRDLSHMASFKIISANILASDGEPMFAPYTTLWTDEGLRVGVVGLTAEDTPVTTDPKNVTSVRFLPPDETLKHYLPLLEEKSDIRLVLSHVGAGVDEQLAAQVAGIHGIVGGHTHTMLVPPKTVGGVYVTQAFEHGKIIGMMTMELHNGEVRVTDSKPLLVTDEIPKDPAMQRLVERFHKTVEKRLSQPLGTLPKALPRHSAEGRARSSLLGSWTTEALRRRAGTHIAFLNAGAIRADLPKGDITYRHLLNAFPFPNNIFTFKLTGEQLLGMISRSWRLANDKHHAFGGFLHLAGVEVEVFHGRINRVTINGKAVDSKTTYTAATISFLAGGGDGYFVLSRAGGYDTGITLYDVLTWAINDKQLPPPKKWKRWKVLADK